MLFRSDLFDHGKCIAAAKGVCAEIYFYTVKGNEFSCESAVCDGSNGHCVYREQSKIFLLYVFLAGRAGRIVFVFAGPWVVSCAGSSFFQGYSVHLYGAAYGVDVYDTIILSDEFAAGVDAKRD